MEPIKFSAIVENLHENIKKLQIEDDKIVATWTQPKSGENEITLNDCWFNWDLLKKLEEVSKDTKDRDKYKGMFKNEN